MQLKSYRLLTDVHRNAVMSRSRVFDKRFLKSYDKFEDEQRVGHTC